MIEVYIILPIVVVCYSSSCATLTLYHPAYCCSLLQFFLSHINKPKELVVKLPRG
jgi:hypothetical protein